MSATEMLGSNFGGLDIERGVISKSLSNEGNVSRQPDLSISSRKRLS